MITDIMVERFKAGANIEELSDEAIRKGLTAVFKQSRLYKSDEAMADGQDEVMTAAEEVLAWLIVEKIGAPDDICYSPDQAQELISSKITP